MPCLLTCLQDTPVWECMQLLLIIFEFPLCRLQISVSSLKRSWSACEQIRAFNEKWEQEFFVTLNADNSSVSCLICGQSISGLKEVESTTAF